MPPHTSHPTDYKVVFLHIPKTAGTSFHLLLSRYYSSNAICPIRNGSIKHVSIDQLSQYNLFSGHYFFNHIERLPQPKLMLTLLRDPTRRILSLYNYQRSFRWEVVEELEAAGWDTPRHAKTMPLAEYLRHSEPSVQQNVDNGITRYLIGQDYVYPDGRLAVSDDSALNIAIANLEKFHAIGFVEYAARSLKRFGEILGIDFPECLEVHNDFSSLGDDCRFELVPPLHVDKATRERLAHCTRLDHKVYDWAINSFRLSMNGIIGEK